MEQISQFNQILKNFKIKAECVNYNCIDNYFYYDLKLNPNARIKDIQKYFDEISLLLQTPCKPRIKILHSQGLLRLEFASTRHSPLKLLDLFSNVNTPKGEINCLLGQSVSGEKIWMDLSKNPHMIIAGTTGSGKSTLLHNIIANLINYNDTNIFLIDPKNSEFSKYENISNIKVFYSLDDSLELMKNLIEIMNSRYEMLRQGKSNSELQSVVVIIDEFADLIMQDEKHQFYYNLCMLAQKCRAAKIHIVLATQRPTANIFGLLKSLCPVRIACKVASHVDSKVILDTTGAENLLGYGDALIKDNSSLRRFQVAYTDADEVVKFFGN